jgi:pyroglutamyl-peptidase
MNMAKKVLLFGFEPFLGYTYNPSGEIAKNLNDHTIEGAKIVGKVLPVKHKEASDLVAQAVKEEKPDVVIGLGLAASKGCIILERVAINRYYFRTKDEQTDEPLFESDREAHFTTLPIQEIKADLEKETIPAEYSFFGDTYVSNEVFYAIMRAAEKNKIKKAGFIHLPLTSAQVIGMSHIHYSTRAGIPSMDEKTMEKAVRIAIAASVK